MRIDMNERVQAFPELVLHEHYGKTVMMRRRAEFCSTKLIGPYLICLDASDGTVTVLVDLASGSMITPDSEWEYCLADFYVKAGKP